MQPIKFGVGQAVRRLEDDALVRGAGRYVADHAPAGLLHAVVLRSPHAHARFEITDVTKAGAMPGVALVLTGADTATLGNLPCLGDIPDTTIAVPPYPVLPRDEVRHVGDAVAFVVADTIAHAKDAAEAIAVDWEPLPHAIGAASALAPGAALVWPRQPGNLVFETSLGDAGATARAFASAAHTVSLALVNQRLVANYLDTRGVIAEVDPGTGRLTLTLGSQGGHHIRDILCNDILRIAPDEMRVVTPDVGGGFGTKAFCYREYALAALAARRLARPVKWIADRNEHFLGDAQGRDKHHHGAAGARSGRTFSRARGRSRRRHGRLSVVLRAVHSVSRGRHVARALRHCRLSCPRPRRLYEYGSGRCLSGRRPARSELCHRAAGRCGGARARHRARPAAAAELHQAGRDALPDGDRQGL